MVLARILLYFIGTDYIVRPLAVRWPLKYTRGCIAPNVIHAVDQPTITGDKVNISLWVKNSDIIVTLSLIEVVKMREIMEAYMGR